MSRLPGASFPKIFTQYSELESFYRFVNNGRVKWEDISAAVSRDTVKKIDESNLSEVLILHDTTAIEAEAKRGKIDEFSNPKKGYYEGFYAHFSLAVTAEGRRILGPMGLFQWGRGKKKLAVESERWWRQINACNEIAGDQKFIHVTDREGDYYRLFCNLLSSKSSFVIRLAHERRLDGKEHLNLFEELRKLQPIGVRSKKISSRKKHFGKKTAQIHPPRDARDVDLGFCAGTFTIKKSHRRSPKELPSRLELNVVRVFEAAPPDGQKPIEWFLVTSEPIESPREIERVIDIYRSRWAIEEFFKALKTGCKVEDRSFKDPEAWYRTVAMLSPIACGIYNIKMCDEAEVNLEKVFTSTQIQILKELAKKQNRKIENMKEALREVAFLGGYIKYTTGPPGWQVLTRGYLDLLLLEQGWAAALRRDM